jgi:hypothetical protein
VAAAQLVLEGEREAAVAAAEARPDGGGGEEAGVEEAPGADREDARELDRAGGGAERPPARAFAAQGDGGEQVDRGARRRQGEGERRGVEFGADLDDRAGARGEP